MTEKIRFAKEPFGSWMYVDAEHIARMHYYPRTPVSEDSWNRQYAEYVAAWYAIDRRSTFERRVAAAYTGVALAGFIIGLFLMGSTRFNLVSMIMVGVGSFMLLSLPVQSIRINKGKGR